MTRHVCICDTTKSARNREEHDRPVVGVLVEAAAAGEDNEGDLGVAEHGELVRLLEQPVPALGERHLPADLVLDPLQLHLPAAHLFFFLRSEAPIPLSLFLAARSLFLSASCKHFLSLLRLLFLQALSLSSSSVSLAATSSSSSFSLSDLDTLWSPRGVYYCSSLVMLCTYGHGS